MTGETEPTEENRGERAALEWSAVLRALREAAGVTQEGWAARLGYGRRTVQRWESGDVAPDAAATEDLVRLCGALRLNRRYRQGALAGVTMSAELLREVLAEARLTARGRPGRARQRAAEEAAVANEGAVLGRHLPAELTSFVGRDAARAEVGRLVETARLVTLTGTGGAGKTRLALRVASDLAGRFPDGARLVELAALDDPRLVVETVAQALGVPEQPDRPPADVLIESLAPRSLLLVLDNCEHLIEACADLAGSLLRGCPGVRILATSREALGVPGEAGWSVPPLAVPEEAAESAPAEALARVEAVRLFVERAATAQAGFRLTARNAAAVARICRRLDGLPLAIELAAARARMLTPEEIAARLDDRFRLLVGGERTAPPRQQTLRGAIDWSYRLLDAAEQQLFERLSVFAGPFSLVAAETVCADERIDPGDVLDGLAELVERSLVVADVFGEAGEAAYHLLETLRAYGRERLAARGEVEALRRRHAAWMVALAEEAARAFHRQDQARWLRRAEREQGNVRAALSWAIERGEAETALRISGALTWSWGVHGHWTEGRGWLERSLALPGAPGKAAGAARGRALVQLANMASMQGDVAAAEGWLGEAIALGRESGDERAIVDGQIILARVLGMRGDREAAARLADEARAGARRLGDAWLESRVLEILAFAALRRGDRATAAALLKEDVDLARQSGDAWSLAAALGELGDLARSEGDHARAGRLYAEALTLRREVGLLRSIPSLRHNQGYVALAGGDTAEARDCFADAVRQFRELGERRGVAECLIGLGALAMVEGRAEDAARLLGAGEAALTALGSELWPSNRADHERTVARARAALGAAGYRAARAEGQQLGVDEALALGLAERR